MKMKKIISALLIFCMFISMTFTVQAAGPQKVTLDLGNGSIKITPTGYTQTGDVAHTGAYVITGYRMADTPLRIVNNTGQPYTFDITLENATILASDWCTAFIIEANAPTVVNIKNIGTSKIVAYNHPAIKVESTAQVDINITNETGANLSLERDYEEYGKPNVFENSKREIVNLTIDGKTMDCDGNANAHSFTKEIWYYLYNDMPTTNLLLHKDRMSFSLVCPKCNMGKETKDIDFETTIDECTDTGTVRCTAMLDGVPYTKEFQVKATQHRLEKCAGVDSSCTKEGNVEYWKCKTCNKMYLDENGTTKAEESDLVVAKKAHKYVDGKCTVCGVAEPTPVVNNNGTPKTGDTSRVLLWTALLLAGAVGMTAVVVNERKNKYFN